MPTVARTFDNPDEVRTPPRGRVEIVDLATAKVARLRLEPGWRWSESVKPIVGTDSCQARHFGMVVSGSMHVMHNDGTEMDVRPGTAYVIEPGHDAWVTGEAPFEGYEFESETVETYATPAR